MIKQLLKDNVNDIEQTTEQEAHDNAWIVKENFKDGYNLYLVDFGVYFGLSALVYADGRRVWSDYALHHRERAENGTLPEYFINEASAVIYSAEELEQPIKDYNDYCARNDFIRNIYSHRRDYISMFFIGKRSKEQEQQIKDIYKFPSCVSFGYYADKEFTEQLTRLFNQNVKLYAEFMRSDEAFRDAVCRELANHEACITGDYEEGLAALGMKFEELTEQRKKIVLEELKKQIHNYA